SLRAPWYSMPSFHRHLRLQPRVYTMRIPIKLALPFVLSLAVVSCARENPVTPIASTAATGSPSFVVALNDARIPAPGSEAASVSAEDKARFDRAAGRVSPLA